MGNQDEPQTSFLGVMRGIRTFTELFGSQKRNLTIAVILSVIFAGVSLVYPIAMKLVFDQLQSYQTQAFNLTTLYAIMAGLVLITIGNGALQHFGRDRFMLRAVIWLENQWPVLAQNKLLHLSMSYHEKENTGVKISKITKGTDRMIDILMRMYFDVIPNLVYIIVNFAIVFILDYRLGLVYVIPFIIAGILQMHLWHMCSPLWLEWEDLKEKSLGIFHQSIINIPTVQNYAQEDREVGRQQKLREKMIDLDNANVRQWHIHGFLTTLCMEFFFFVCIMLAVHLMVKGEIKQGTIVYIIATTNFTFRLVKQLIESMNNMMKHFYSVDRFKKLLDEPIDLKNASEGAIVPAMQGEISVRKLEFTYSATGLDVLRGIDLTIHPGEMLALVGPSGCGKSTMVKILSRVYDFTSGSICLDGVDIRNLDLYWYRRLFASVPQGVDIFESTVRANIAYSQENVSEALIIQALRAAHLEYFIEDAKRFPKGLDTEVGERGIKLSGGQKQRIGIARAYVAIKMGAKFLVLDEATSSLDSETERAIQQTIQELRSCGQVTMIVIAHRLSTIHMADQIVVIDDGKVIDSGNHEKLMLHNGLYAKLVRMQSEGMLRA